MDRPPPTLRVVLTRSAPLVLLLLMVPAPVAAHGLGGRSDLPLPLSYVLVGAGTLVVGTFLFLAVMWTEPRLQGGPRFRRLVGRSTMSGGERVGRSIAVAALAVVVLGAVVPAGDGVTLATVLVWVVWWVGVPTAAALAGNLHRFVNPWWWVDRRHRADGPGRRWGVWPAVAAFWLVVWLELVWPLVDPLVALDTTRLLGIAAIAFSGYLVWAATVGVPHALADPFAVFGRALSGIAPLGALRGEGGYRGWLKALPVLPRWPGMATFMVLAVGTVVYDGVSSTPWWRETFPAWDEWWFATIALAVVPAAFGGLYRLASWVAARRTELTTTEVARSFAHTLAPIALAWFVSHYVTLLLFEGQLLPSAIADPFARSGGADTGGIAYWVSPATVWWVQAAITVVGHMLAVLLAHDRALAVLGSEEDAVAGQYAMLVLMVALTGFALAVLAAA